MRLRHGAFTALKDIALDALVIGQRGIGTIDIARAVLVNEEQVILAGPPGDVDMSPQLDIAFRPKIVRRPSPQVGRPSGVNQSTRI